MNDGRAFGFDFRRSIVSGLQRYRADLPVRKTVVLLPVQKGWR
jgi:hypothetical protein